MLFIVPTPIGNLKDITLRALDTLQSVDGIICEDTRRTSLLLQHFNIKKPLYILNDFNEPRVFNQITDILKSGQNLALVSDAGTPLISDPGYKLIREIINEQIPVDSLPGPSAVITAITLSGLSTDKFMFLGYFPDKPGHRQSTYKNIAEIHRITPVTFIVYIAPFKIIKTLQEMNISIGDISITLAKELSKVHQSVETKTISEWLKFYGKQSPKGEYVMLFRLP